LTPPDCVVWRKGSGTTYTQDDFNTWRANFGATLNQGSGSSTNATIPRAGERAVVGKPFDARR
jgi:hypothetical protein